MDDILAIFSIAPGATIDFFILFTIIVFVNELLRTYLMIEHTASVFVHICVVVMTLIPALIMIVILLYAAIQFPHRAWINLGYICLAFIPWYIAGISTFLARPDSEGADVGFMFIGFLIVLPVGIIITFFC